MLNRDFFVNSFFPESPGIYLFKNREGNILYIGKAKNLKKRIASYFIGSLYADWKILNLLEKGDNIEYICTETEKDALILEAELISHQKPPFNRLLTSDSPFIYIVFYKKTEQNFPKIALEYKIIDFKNIDFICGPFLEKKYARYIYVTLLEIFRLKICNKQIPNGCLEYHIGLCSGFCRKEFFDKKNYEKKYSLALNMFKKKPEEFFNLIQKEITARIKNKEFEKAQELHKIKTRSEQMISSLDEYKNRDYEYIIEDTLSRLYIIDAEIEKGFLELSELLKIKVTTIDCIDISHFQSHAMVGSYVRFKKGVFLEKESFCIKLDYFEQQHDYRALQETVLKKLSMQSDLPSVLLIDGGKGQLNAIRQLNLPIPIMSIAKREERLFLDNGLEIVLNTLSVLGKLIISLRDSAHRIAINNHRKLFLKQYRLKK